MPKPESPLTAENLRSDPEWSGERKLARPLARRDPKNVISKRRAGGRGRAAAEGAPLGVPDPHII